MQQAPALAAPPLQLTPERDAFSDLVLDTLRLQETIARAQNAPADERAWFLQDTRQTLYVAGLYWMVRHDEACELLEPLPLAFLPGMPPWFCGLAHWHGQPLPVMDLAGYWQLSAASPAPPQASLKTPSAALRRMLLVLGHGSQAAGIYIDRLPGHLRLSDAQAQAQPQASAPPAMRSHVRARYSLGKKSWWDVDVPALLRDLEHALQAHSAS